MISHDLSTPVYCPTSRRAGRRRIAPPSPVNRPFLSIVVPAYNEERRIGSCIDRLRQALPGLVPSWEIVVADDGSRDRTREIVCRRGGGGRPDPPARTSPSRQGRSRPPRTARGARRMALHRRRRPGDAAGQPDSLSRYTPGRRHRAGHRVARGARVQTARRAVDSPLDRPLLQLVRPACSSSRGISDTQCGFKLFSARAVELIVSRTSRVTASRSTSRCSRSPDARACRSARSASPGTATRRAASRSAAARRRFSTSSASAGACGAAPTRLSRDPRPRNPIGSVRSAPAPGPTSWR